MQIAYKTSHCRRFQDMRAFGRFGLEVRCSIQLSYGRTAPPGGGYLPLSAFYDIATGQ